MLVAGAVWVASRSRREPALRVPRRLQGPLALVENRLAFGFVVPALLVVVGWLGRIGPGDLAVLQRSPLGWFPWSDLVGSVTWSGLLVAAGLMLLTGWLMTWLVDLQDGVLYCPLCWLGGGLALAAVGALAWAGGSGPVRGVGAIALVGGIGAIKMAIPALMDRISPADTRVSNTERLLGTRTARAVELTALGAVASAAGYLLVMTGTRLQRLSYLSIGVLVAVAGLSLVGVAAHRLLMSVPYDQSGDVGGDTPAQRLRRPRARLTSGLLVAAGLVAISWGLVRTIEAAGDWLGLALVICVMLVGLGAWFVFKGEALVFLALLTFVVPWAMQDRVTAPAEVEMPQTSDRGAILAIGDSFMSGEGAKRFLPGTNDPGVNTCRRAPTAYAAEVAKRTERDIYFLACSGATMANVRSSGPVSETDEPDPVEVDPATGAVRADLEVLLADRQPVAPTPQMPNSPDDVAGGQTQLDALGDPRLVDDPDSIDLVVVSIGGNDTGFSPIVKACLLPTNCAEQRDLFMAKAEALELDLAATYREIDELTGDAVVVVVPYPEYITPQPCDRLASGEEFEFVVAFIDALNGTIARAARRANVLVADTSGAFEGHSQCSPDPSANLVSLTPASGASFLSRLNPGNWVSGSMHPKEAGHEAQADLLVPLASDLLEQCGPEPDACRPNCPAVGALPTAANDATGNEADRMIRPHTVDVCAAPGRVTPDDQLVARNDAADLLLESLVDRELFAAAGALVPPFAALVAGGLILALGLIGRPTIGVPARFLAPDAPGLPGLGADDRVHVIAQSASSDSAELICVVAAGQDRPPPPVTAIEYRLADDPPATRPVDAAWSWFEGGRHSFYWLRAAITGLEAGRCYQIEPILEAGGHGYETVVAQATTLPGPDATRLSLIVGSCFFRDSPVASQVGPAYRRLQDLSSNAASSPPLYNMWLGDQVYIDEPRRTGLRSSDIADPGGQALPRHLGDRDRHARPRGQEVLASESERASRAVASLGEQLVPARRP